jgi:hypothetical protein
LSLLAKIRGNGGTVELSGESGLKLLKVSPLMVEVIKARKAVVLAELARENALGGWYYPFSAAWFALSCLYDFATAEGLSELAKLVQVVDSHYCISKAEGEKKAAEVAAQVWLLIKPYRTIEGEGLLQTVTSVFDDAEVRSGVPAGTLNFEDL